jgi:hypothetical protein
MGEEINKAYYAVIPANVRYDKELPPNAKLLYGEITALCNQKGYCWATNDYFAKLYNCAKSSISRWIANLKERGYINIELIYKEGSKEIEYRCIKICEYPIPKNENTPTPKNEKDNNTSSFNNTFNKKKESKKEPEQASYDTILSAIENESLRELYYEFIKMRKMIKAPLTNRGLKTLITKVNELEPNNVFRQKLMLENAIMNNWKSVYPLKDEGSEDDAVTDIVCRGYKNTKLDELREIYG